MNKFLIGAALSTILAFSAVPANAGCVTGALVGGIAGHFLGGHGLAGAAAGCAGGALLKRHQNQQVRPYNDQYRQNYNGNTGQYPSYNR